MSRVVVVLALITACGPIVDQGEPTEGSGSGTTANDVTSTGSETSSGVASTSSSSSADDASSSTTEAALPVLELLSATLGCVEAEGVELFVDVPLEDPENPEPPPSSCGAPADVDSPGIAIWLSSWNGQGGTYSTDDEGLVVLVTPGMEEATGTIVLEVSEPWLPLTISVDVDDEGVPVQREIDLSMCLEVIPPVPCR